MQIKVNELKKSYDYIIVGAGIIGMTILRELIEQGKKNILIIESGSVLSKNPYPEFMDVSSKKFRIKNKSRFSGVGGCSNVWGSICGVFDKTTINYHYKKNEFPINYSEYKYYLNKSKKYGYPDFDEFNDIGEKNNYKTLKTKKFIKIKPNIIYFHSSSILESKKVHFLQNKYVEKIVSQKRNNKIFFSDRNLNKIINSSNGKKIILCANTIENYKILKKSNLNISKQKLGKGFMNHPKGVIGSIKVNKNLNNFYSQNHNNKITWNGIQLKKAKYNHYLKINHGFKIPFFDFIIKSINGNLKRYKGEFPDFKTQVKSVFSFYILDFLKIIDKVLNLFFKNYLYIQAFTEIKMSDENYIYHNERSNKTYVNYQLSLDEIRSLNKLITRFEIEFKTKIRFKPKSLQQLKKLVSLDASHHMGGVVCGIDKINSVVDLNLCVHNTDNIYVCGGAIFPFSGVVNPTMSYVALAIWLSNKVL